MKRLLLVVAFLLVFSSLLHAADYVIGEGDQLEVAVWGIKELNFIVKVRPDGKITVPGLGDVAASGQTPEGLQKQLAVQLKELVKNPIVTVTVKEITNSKAFIFGGGVKAGMYDLNRRTTLLQLLCSIGETKGADWRNSYLLRNNVQIKKDFHQLFVAGDITGDLPLVSGDSLFIPILLDKNVYVLGAVTTPKALEFREGMTVVEAIMEAGGFTKFADMNDVVIRRKNGQKETSQQVKLKKLINDGDLKQNITLKPGDYIIVKESLF